MDKITTIYTELLAQLALIFPNRNRLLDSYSLENNPITTMRKAWGLKLGGTALLDDYICNIVYQQDIEFMLVSENLLYSRQNSSQDAELISLISDTVIFMRNLVKSFNLSDKIDIVVFNSSDPIENLAIDKTAYLIKRIVFSIRVTDNI